MPMTFCGKRIAMLAFGYCSTHACTSPALGTKPSLPVQPSGGGDLRLGGSGNGHHPADRYVGAAEANPLDVEPDSLRAPSPWPGRMGVASTWREGRSTSLG